MMNVIVGFITGVIASMGLGGGFVLMIWLTLFCEVGHKAAQGVNLLFFLPVALVSLILHIKGGLIDKTLLRKYLNGGIFGALLGTLAMQIIAADLLRRLYALFLLYFGIREMLCAKRDDKHQELQTAEHM